MWINLSAEMKIQTVSIKTGGEATDTMETYNKTKAPRQRTLNGVSRASKQRVSASRPITRYQALKQLLPV